MRKKYINSPFATVWLIYLVCIAVIILHSCRKTDKVDDLLPNVITLSQMENKFFNTHRSGDPLETSLVNFLKRENDSLKFINQTVGLIGYPRWDKIIAITNSRTGSRGGSDSSGVSYIIPFVRELENYVNASMIINAFPTDTSYYYKCDWQYSTLQNNSSSVRDSAEFFAIFFMAMDNNVFGHREFAITDSSLFRRGDSSASKIKFDSVNTAGRNSIMMPEIVCSQTTILYEVPCAGRTSPPVAGRNNIQFVCYDEYIHEYCWVEYVDDGTGSGNSGGSGGGGTGGVPPECVPGSSRLFVVNPCEPGWVPILEEPLPPEDPCVIASNAAKKMDSLYTKGKVDSMLSAIPGWQNLLVEKGFPIYADCNKTSLNGDTIISGYLPGEVQTGTDSSVTIIANLLVFNPYHFRLWAGNVHTHPQSGYSCPSPADIYNNCIKQAIEEPLFQGSIICAANGDKYALSVTNIAQAMAFYNTMSQNLNGIKWNENSDVGKAFKSTEIYYKKIYKGNANQINLAYEMAMAAVIKQFNMGVSLSKMDASGNFKPIIISTTTPNPSKPNKKVYTQDCL